MKLENSMKRQKASIRYKRLQKCVRLYYKNVTTILNFCNILKKYFLYFNKMIYNV